MTLVLQDTLVLSPATAEHLQEEIDTLKAASDVTDVVANYEELLAYDTSKLTDNDIIKVLQDETHEDGQSYYRWVASEGAFEYIGSIATPPVTSVNSKTGDVILDAADVKAIPQLTTLPAASASNANKIVQYTGADDTVAGLTHGYFYECVSDGGNPATYSWEQVNVQPTVDPLPDQTGHNGEFLTTNGSVASWATVDALPSQTGQNGKILTTDGTDASWTDPTTITFRRWGANE